MQALHNSDPQINTRTGDVFHPEYEAMKAEVIATAVPVVEGHIAKTQRWALIAYHLRDYSLVFGFILLIVSKFVGVYVSGA